MQATCLQRRQVSSSTRHHPAHAAAAARSRTSKLHCNASVVWRQLEGSKAWVAHPRAARVNGVIHFLGGAFAGAAPQLLYNDFIELLADAGYTTIATPYAVTFRHDQCAKAVRKTFLDSVSELRSSGRSYLVPSKAPCFGVGHSNGALLQLLIGSLEPGATQANVIISYNNLQVSDAIPIPGFLEGLQPTVQAARSMSSTEESGSNSSSSSSGRASPGLLQLTAQQVLVAAAATAPVLSLEQRQLLAGAAPALEQLSSVINEVGDGLTDFRPTPEESRALIAAGYSCPATLLVQFENDNFDETPEMQQILTARINKLSSSSSGDSTAAGASVAAAAAAAGSASQADAEAVVDAWSSIDEDIDIDKVLQQLQQLQQQQQGWQQQQQPGLPGLQALLLQGSHVTPCGAQVGSGISNSSSSELKNLASNVLGWLDNARRAGVGSRGMAAVGVTQQQQVAPAAAGVAAGAGSDQAAAAEAVAAGVASAAGAPAGAAIQQ